MKFVISLGDTDSNNKGIEQERHIILVTGLSSDTSANDLKTFFRKYGKVWFWKNQMDATPCYSMRIWFLLGNSYFIQPVNINLRNYWFQIGRIKIMTNTRVPGSQRFAHISVPSLDELNHLVDTLNGVELKGKSIRVAKVCKNINFYI